MSITAAVGKCWREKCFTNTNSLAIRIGVELGCGRWSRTSHSFGKTAPRKHGCSGCYAIACSGLSGVRQITRRGKRHLKTQYTPGGENSLSEVIYAATPLLREPGVLLCAMGRDLVNSRQLAYRLLVRSLRSQYRQSLLGYFWVIVAPIAATAGVLFLNKQKILVTVETAVPP